MNIIPPYIEILTKKETVEVIHVLSIHTLMYITYFQYIFHLPMRIIHRQNILIFWSK